MSRPADRGHADEVRRAITDAAGPVPRIDLGLLLGNLGIDALVSGGTVTMAGDLLVAHFGDPPFRWRRSGTASSGASSSTVPP